MNPRHDEWLAIDRGDDLRRDAAGSQLLARARDGAVAERRRFDVRLAVRGLVDRFARFGRRPRMDVTRPLPGGVVAKPSRVNSR